MAEPKEPRIPKESPPFDADNKWTRTWIMYFESLFSLSVKEAVRQTLEVAVTHSGELTKDLPVFGDDAAVIKVGTKSGNTNKVVTNTGTNVTGNTVKWDANGNLIDAGSAPGGGSGTVTHTGGALTADQPIFGAGSADIKVGTKTGNTNKLVSNTGTNVTGNTVKWDASGNLIDAGSAPGGGSGTVTSVALTVPAEFSVSGSPVTTSGTLAVSKATQSANTVFAGPTTGSAAAPTFRAVVPADLPLASSSAFGAVKVDGTTITASSGVISAVGGGGSSIITPPPLVSSLTWMNQSTSTAVDAANGIFLTQPFGATQYIAALVQNAPATPWTFTAGIQAGLFAVNFNSCGITLSDGTKHTTLRVAYNSSVGISFPIDDWTSSTVYSANILAATALSTLPFPIWFRATDNGTNIIWSYSVDGVNFIQLFSRARTTFQTPTKFGICANAQSTSRDVNFTCISWKVS